MNKLRNLKIGDKVIVGKGGSSDRIAEVGFVSDTQIKVNGLRYNKNFRRSTCWCGRR